MTILNKAKTTGTVLIVSCLLVLFTGCEKKGPAEEAGEKIDNVAEDINEKIEETGDNLSNDGPAENIGEKLDDAAKYTGEKIEQAGDNIQNSIKSSSQ